MTIRNGFGTCSDTKTIPPFFFCVLSPYCLLIKSNDDDYYYLWFETDNRGVSIQWCWYSYELIHIQIILCRKQKIDFVHYKCAFFEQRLLSMFSCHSVGILLSSWALSMSQNIWLLDLFLTSFSLLRCCLWSHLWNIRYPWINMFSSYIQRRQCTLIRNFFFFLFIASFQLLWTTYIRYAVCPVIIIISFIEHGFCTFDFV